MGMGGCGNGDSMTTYNAIIETHLIIELEAGTYNEAVMMALDYTNILNELDSTEQIGVRWELEQVQEAPDESTP